MYQKRMRILQTGPSALHVHYIWSERYITQEPTRLACRFVDMSIWRLVDLDTSQSPIEPILSTSASPPRCKLRWRATFSARPGQSRLSVQNPNVPPACEGGAGTCGMLDECPFRSTFPDTIPSSEPRANVTFVTV